MAEKKSGSARRSEAQGVFHTKGGRTYLENLRRLHPSEQTEKAVRSIEADEQQRRQRNG